MKAQVEKALNTLVNLQPIIGNGLLTKQQLAFIDPSLDVAMTALREALAEAKHDYSICPSCGGMASDPIVPVEARQEPVAIPPDASPTEWRDAVWKVWKLARTGNNTIPSHWLDAMREMAIAATNPAPTQQDGNTVGVALRSLTDAEFAYAWRYQTGRIMGGDRALLLKAKEVTEAAHGIAGSKA